MCEFPLDIWYFLRNLSNYRNLVHCFGQILSVSGLLWWSNACRLCQALAFSDIEPFLVKMSILEAESKWFNFYFRTLVSSVLKIPAWIFSSGQSPFRFKIHRNANFLSYNQPQRFHKKTAVVRKRIIAPCAPSCLKKSKAISFVRQQLEVGKFETSSWQCVGSTHQL